MLATDARFVIQLPDKGKKTIWDLLTPEGRKYLTEQLLLDYQRGKYDADMVGKKQNTDLKDAMERVELFALEDPEGNPVAGVSPLLLLHAAAKRRPVGLCRHGACAMTGLLGELGISEKNIRMIAGKKTMDRSY